MSGLLVLGWFVTRRAVAVGVGGDVGGLVQAAVWGLVRSAQSENPDVFCWSMLMRIPARWGCWRVCSGERWVGESQLAVRGGVLLVPRLARMGSGGVLVVPVGVGEGWRLDVVGGGGTFEDLALVGSPGLVVSLGWVRCVSRCGRPG